MKEENRFFNEVIKKGNLRIKNLARCNQNPFFIIVSNDGSAALFAKAVLIGSIFIVNFAIESRGLAQEFTPTVIIIHSANTSGIPTVAATGQGAREADEKKSGKLQARQPIIPCVPKEVATSKIIGNVPGPTRIHFSIELPIRNQKERDRLSREIHNPQSSSYGRKLTEEEYDEKFSPSEGDYQALIHFLESNRMTITDRFRRRTILGVSGTAEDIQKIFHIHLYYYQRPNGAKFRAPDREPFLDLNLPLVEITGLDDLLRIEGAPIPKSSPTTP